MNYYPRYPGDFMRKTGHLSLLEIGAYDRLLDHYYATMRPLPAGVAALYRIAGAVEDHEREAVQRIVTEFFPLGDDGWRHNSRADEEIVKWKAKASGGRARAKKLTDEERSDIARRAADARWRGAG